MKRNIHRCASAVFALFSAVALAQTPAPGLNAKSEKAQGLIMLTSDLVPDQGRLVFKIVAYNKGTAPVALDPASITLTTAAGKPVPLATLAQLEDETREAFGGPPARQPDDYTKMSAAQRPVIITSSGERDISGYTGGDGVSSSVAAAAGKRRWTRPPIPAQGSARQLACGHIAARNRSAAKRRRRQYRHAVLQVRAQGRTPARAGHRFRRRASRIRVRGSPLYVASRTRSNCGSSVRFKP